MSPERSLLETGASGHLMVGASLKKIALRKYPPSLAHGRAKVCPVVVAKAMTDQKLSGPEWLSLAQEALRALYPDGAEGIEPEETLDRNRVTRLLAYDSAAMPVRHVRVFLKALGFEISPEGEWDDEFRTCLLPGIIDPRNVPLGVRRLSSIT
jgi:hypothetical protein